MKSVFEMTADEWRESEIRPILERTDLDRHAREYWEGQLESPSGHWTDETFAEFQEEARQEAA